MNKIKKIFKHRFVSPVILLLVASIIAALNGFICTAITCVVLILLWVIDNGLLIRIDGSKMIVSK